MGRWTQYDEVSFAIRSIQYDEIPDHLVASFQDAYRLPEGMTRVGYDADTGRYTYRETTGKIYQGEPYSQYGVLRPIHDTPASSQPRRTSERKLDKPTAII